MAFTEQEKAALLQVKGVGATVIKRFEEIGIDSFELLKDAEYEAIAETVAEMLNITCWKNSPQAKAAINGAIERARVSFE